MMKKQNKKRGFTIIELVIVVTVIAILSAVLIPTFAGIIKRANRSADEQAVASMNTALIAADESVDTPEEVIAFLAGEGYAVGTYAPLSKGFSFVYSASLNKILLLSENDGIVFPKEYADCDDAVTLVNDKGQMSETVADQAGAAVAGVNGGVVSIASPLVLDTAMNVTKDLTVNLNADISIPNDTAGNGVFYVGNKSTLILNGNGTVNGVGNNDWNMALFAENKAEVIINGGNYTNVGAKDSTNPVDPHFDLIYVKYGAKVTITGGTFKCETPEWTLNSSDDKPGTIEVKGGKFYKFDPSNCKTEGEGTNFVAEGYEVVQDGDWYIVQAKKAA